MKRLVFFGISLVNLAAAASLLLSYLSCYVHPSWHWILGFMGLLFPALLLVNVCFVVFWIVVRRWFFLVSLLCILVGWDFVQRQVAFPQFLPSIPAAEDDASWKLITFNVRSFDVYGFLKDKDVRGDIEDFMHAEAPDVLCIQEFYYKGLRDDQWAYALSLSGMDHLLGEHREQHVYGLVGGSGVLTISRFPIVNKGILEFPNSGNVTIYTDLVREGDTIRVYNCHLHSFALRKADTDLLDTIRLVNVEEKTDYLIGIGHRMRNAYVRRASQVEMIAQHMRQSPYPVVVCGDFNDVPVSYTYQKMSRGLQDAFVESGSGLGGTYVLRDFFPVRIDYVLFSPWFTSREYRTPAIHLSDHEPVVVRLTEKKAKRDEP